MLVIIKSNFHTFSATFSQKVKAIRKEKHCDLSVTEQLMINELYCGTDSEVSVGVGVWQLLCGKRQKYKRENKSPYFPLD